MSQKRTSRTQSNSPSIALQALWVGVLAIAGCAQKMENQPRVEALEASVLFADGRGSRELPPHTVASLPPFAAAGPRATARAAPFNPSDPDHGFLTGRSEAGLLESLPDPLRDSQDLMSQLRRGQNRYQIFCVPCHGPLGNGDGLVPKRGFPFPPSYHTDRLRGEPLGYIFAVISSGRGPMPSYGELLTPEDRWAVAAYVRALQLSQHAPAELLNDDELQRLMENP